ncbi:MAG: glycosyltransferase family 39 protein [Chloroflexi bacterium]|nr:glycosyltransferase family 39 protein [Chloroflexota bacterium]
MRETHWALLALGLTAGIKAWLIASDGLPFNADEAVVGLMARHILQGERPVFFYGQAYMGSLDAWLNALAFALLGAEIWVMRLVQSILYLGVVWSTYLLGREAFPGKGVGALAGFLMALPSVNVMLYTSASLGGYGEALLIGNWILLGALRIAKTRHRETREVTWMYFGWGLLAGTGFWAFGLTLVYILPAGIFLAWKGYLAGKQGLRRPAAMWKGLGRVIAGALLGASPWWVYALRHGLLQPVGELGGGAIAGVEGLGYLAQTGRHLGNLLLLGSTVILGMRPPWGNEWLALPLLPFVLIFWAAALVFNMRLMKKRDDAGWEMQVLLNGVAAALFLGFIVTPFGADPSGRYFLPLAAPMALTAAQMVFSLKPKLGRAAWGFAALILVYNFWGAAHSLSRNPPGMTTQFNPVTRVNMAEAPKVIAFLEGQGETRGYSNYWTAYPLAFLSDERSIYAPRLPYHPDFRYTERDDRYAPYSQAAGAAEKTAYITTHHPALDERLRQAFSGLGVTWREAKISDFQIFYALSRPVHPGEIGLGMTTP